jgi:hypothetical protein
VKGNPMFRTIDEWEAQCERLGNHNRELTAALAKANADKDTLLNCLSHAMFTLDSYRTLVIQHKDRQPMYRLGKHAEEAINLIMAIIRKNGLSVEPEALSEVQK